MAAKLKKIRVIRVIRAKKLLSLQAEFQILKLNYYV